MKSGFRQHNYGLWVVTCSLGLLVANSFNNSAFSKNLSSKPLTQEGVVKNQSQSACSKQNLDTLTTQLLQDLPSYANRATQRARRSVNNEVYSYVLIAGKPVFQPLPLSPEGYTAERQKKVVTKVEQVFFTTLERHYTGGKAVEVQQFHWLLLTPTKSGWRLVMMFTQTGGYPKQQPPSPPRNSSNGAIAQGVKTWLRDCRARSISQ
ncbi:hypothetical protein [Halotia branconii]|uniref:Uncharacterized protein n=1 Tax=Halotia branconii CENA392 TaxID=1539056 RepID=A0AAJ6NVJ2_9CYAN|nr:hypothetical protein [Halotia branconii]WGV27183.1 hypothetical protein QI031_06740 [Halotia branconii CENA392]